MKKITLKHAVGISLLISCTALADSAVPTTSDAKGTTQVLSGTLEGSAVLSKMHVCNSGQCEDYLIITDDSYTYGLNNPTAQCAFKDSLGNKQHGWITVKPTHNDQGLLVINSNPLYHPPGSENYVGWYPAVYWCEQGIDTLDDAKKADPMENDSAVLQSLFNVWNPSYQVLDYALAQTANQISHYYEKGWVMTLNGIVDTVFDVSVNKPVKLLRLKN